jgi:hypothetical protein
MNANLPWHSCHARLRAAMIPKTDKTQKPTKPRSDLGQTSVRPRSDLGLAVDGADEGFVA